MSEFWRAPMEGEVEVQFSDGLRLKLPVARNGQLAILQGDILLGDVDKVLGTKAGVVPMGIGITGAQFRWSNCTIPFEIDPTLPEPERVTEAIRHWEGLTPIRFVKRTPTNRHGIPDFLSFENLGNCASYIGRRTGRQPVSLGPNCRFGSVVHEIGHAVGLWHEQSRGDRDQWIDVRLDRVIPLYRHNFSQHTEDGRDLGEYDYDSIMHYPADAFSVDGTPTIVPKKPGAAIGQRTSLSVGDRAAVSEMYGCTGNDNDLPTST